MIRCQLGKCLFYNRTFYKSKQGKFYVCCKRTKPQKEVYQGDLDDEKHLEPCPHYQNRAGKGGLIL